MAHSYSNLSLLRWSVKMINLVPDILANKILQAGHHKGKQVCKTQNLNITSNSIYLMEDKLANTMSKEPTGTLSRKENV